MYAPHGTPSRYKQRCRCDKCRAAYSRYRTKWKQRTGQPVREGGRKIDHEALRSPDTLFVGVLIFGEKRCPSCGYDLPANTDYFKPRKDGSLYSACRLCDNIGRARRSHESSRASA